MTEGSMTVSEAVSKLLAGDSGSLFRVLLQNALQSLIDMEAESKIGAGRFERSDERVTYRNGTRERELRTAVGELQLKIPKLRDGSFFPGVLEPRRRVDKALVSVIQECYVHGISTRKLDDIVKAMGLDGIDKSQVSRICEDLMKGVEQFRTRPLDESRYVYVWLDATYIKVRDSGRVMNRAFLLAIGVTETGEREVLGFTMGAAESYSSWMSFLRSLVQRGLRNPRLTISDAHEGLKRALAETFTDCSWQRCRVHFMRNVLSLVGKIHQPVVSAAVKQIFAQPDLKSAEEAIHTIADKLRQQFPRVAQKLDDEAYEVLSYYTFPVEHRQQIHSTNGLERLNRELKRRSDVVGIFPNDTAVLRLLGSVLIDQHDEWCVTRRPFSQESMKKVLRNDPDTGAVASIAVATALPESTTE